MVYRQIAVINFPLMTPMGKELPGAKVGTERGNVKASEEAGRSFLWNSTCSTLFEEMQDTRKPDTLRGRRDASDTRETEMRNGVSISISSRIGKYGWEGQKGQTRRPY